MKIETIKLEELHPAKKNIRMHPPEQIKEYKRSLQKFEQIKPIVIDEKNNIIIGNGLYLAMKEMGYEKADCYRKTGLSEKEKKKLMIADNRIFDLGSDDLSVFDDFLNEFKLDDNFDIPGYSEDLLETLTLDVEEATEALSEYGIIDGEKAEEIKKAEFQSNVIEQPSYISSQPTHEQPDTGILTEGDTKGSFIICPKCGEKIWL